IMKIFITGVFSSSGFRGIGKLSRSFSTFFGSYRRAPLPRPELTANNLKISWLLRININKKTNIS
ncbi:MAG: hypothetical protein ABGX68_04530, partial [Methylococcales bacterium]